MGTIQKGVARGANKDENKCDGNGLWTLMQRLNEVTWGEVAIAAAAGAAIAVWSLPVAGLPVAAAYGYLGWALVLIMLTDFRAFRIPDQLSLPLTPLGLAVVWWLWPDSLLPHALAALGGAAALYGVNAAYRAWRGYDGLGMGDVKLTAAAGAWVGPEGLIYVILLACLAALAGVAIAGLLLTKNLDAGRTRLAFGGYESLALLATVLWQLQ
jgi:leader peptidase (prepilin peptidase)/N-methyltransferase